VAWAGEKIGPLDRASEEETESVVPEAVREPGGLLAGEVRREGQVEGAECGPAPPSSPAPARAFPFAFGVPSQPRRRRDPRTGRRECPASARGFEQRRYRSRMDSSAAIKAPALPPCRGRDESEADHLQLLVAQDRVLTHLGEEPVAEGGRHLQSWGWGGRRRRGAVVNVDAAMALRSLPASTPVDR